MMLPTTAEADARGRPAETFDVIFKSTSQTSMSGLRHLPSRSHVLDYADAWGVHA
jgi:hypothetical protein